MSTGPEDGGSPLEHLLGPHCYSRTVILDLSQAPSVTTSGIGWLLSCNRRFASSGGKLILFGVAPQVMDVLQFAMVTPHLLIAPGRKAAEQAALQGAGENGPPPRPDTTAPGRSEN